MPSWGQSGSPVDGRFGFGLEAGPLWLSRNDTHGFRLVIEPLELSGSGDLSQDTDFAGAMFPAGATEGTFKFNAYKLTYRYTFRDRGAWRWRIGFTGVIRDANIELRQGNAIANDDDVYNFAWLHYAVFNLRYMFD